MSLNEVTLSTDMSPWERVPVLSKAMERILASFSSDVPDLMMTPTALALLMPEMKATGAARISGQGEATTRTSTKRMNSPEKAQARPAMR